jgi:hypothetical protein
VRGETIRTCGQSNVELEVGVRRGLDLRDPFVESEGASLLVLDILDGLSGRADSGVVELSEDKVEGDGLENR